MKYYLALFQKIKKLYRERTGSSDDLLLICPSSRMYEEDDLKLLLPDFMISGERKGEALLKKQDISYQLNSIPSSEKFWDVNPDKVLFDVYGQLLQSAQPKAGSNATAGDGNARSVLYDSKNKPTKEKKAYDKYLKDLETVLGEWEQHLSKRPQAVTDEDLAAWTERLNSIHLRKERALSDLELLGSRGAIEAAMSEINRLSEYDRFISRLADAKALMKSLEKTGIQSLAGYHDINFIPFDFMDNPSGWSSMELQKSELDALYAEARQEKEFPEDYLSLEYDEKYISGIELEFAVVGLVRSWLDLEPVKSEYYSWDGAKPVSDGATINGQFLLPAYPRKLVLIRNLKINIDASVKPEQVEGIGQLVRFGPMLMKTQLFVNASNNRQFLKAVDNNVVLKSDNLVYLTRKAELMEEPKPAAPAAPAPAPAAPVIMNVSPAMRRVARPATLMRDVRLETVEAPIALRLSRELIQPVRIIDLPTNLTNVTIAVTDSLSTSPLYKCSVSVVGTNNSFFREVETGKDGRITCSLPTGAYRVEIRKDGYSVASGDLNIDNNTPVSRQFALVRQTVSYSSYFLLGVVCERLPKIPHPHTP